MRTIRGMGLWKAGAGALALGALALGAASLRETNSPEIEVSPAAARLSAAYERWVAEHEAQGGDRNVRFVLGYNKGLSGEFSKASGSAVLDRIAGSIEVEVNNLPAGEFDVWLVDNREATDASVAPQPSDAQLLAGRLVRDEAGAKLTAELGTAAFESLDVDLVVVARAGESATDGLLYGSASLFQRMYTALHTPGLFAQSDIARYGEPQTSLFGVRLAYAASQKKPLTPEEILAQKIAKGQFLFERETFRGNGRTCASCHPLALNTQLSASDIARFKDSDPLFAAEFQPALAFTPNGPKFEVPLLMRGAALIVENQDGDGDLVNNFNLRSIPHTLALPTSLKMQPGPGRPVHATGWSGDGAPNSGSLRDFATGAVTQHFPRTLARNPGSDFRLPTDDELDAMEAFQLSLGRDQDVQLPLPFRSPIIARGQEIFRANDPQQTTGQGRCDVCHSNAGATTTLDVPGVFVPGDNANFNTHVEKQIDRPAQLLLAAAGMDLTPANSAAQRFRPDGGFGLGDPEALIPGTGVGSLANGFGDATFNTPPLIEAADTAPFFHDNSVRTLEGAVAFYNSRAFNDPLPPFLKVQLEPTQVEAVAAFLRALNALENIRSAHELISTVNVKKNKPKDSKRILQRAAGEMLDAIKVLSQADLHPEVVMALSAGIDHKKSPVTIKGKLSAALSRLDQARSLILAPAN